jgi:hypothetical protein
MSVLPLNGDDDVLEDRLRVALQDGDALRKVAILLQERAARGGR